MTLHPKRYIGLGLLLLLLTVVAPPVADWLRDEFRLPAGYGAEGDRERAVPIPARVRDTVEELSGVGEGNWVKETAEAGAWVYELHLSRGGESSVIRMTSNGSVIPTDTRTAGEPGGCNRALPRPR
jgi:hypothetical protein